MERPCVDTNIELPVMMQEIGSVAMVIELEWNKFADTAIEQIKRRQYTDKIAEYSGKMLLV